MGLNHSPSIVTNGLVLCLDAANSKSYSGSGNVWYDLSKNKYNGSSSTTFPTFTANNMGGFTFNGSTDSITLSNYSSSIVNNFSYEIWCRPTATHEIDTESTSGTGGLSGQRYLIVPSFGDPTPGAGISIGTNGVSVYEHGSGYLAPLLVNQVTISSPTQIFLSYVNKTPTVYINGVLSRTGLTSTKTNVSQNGNPIGSHPEYGSFQGQIFVIKYYNRALSVEEIQQNFNALRGRFNI